MRRLLPRVLILTALLSGCSVSVSSTPTRTTTPPATTTAPSPSPAGYTRAQVLAGDFVKEFRGGYPDITYGRPMNDIADDGTRMCNWLLDDSLVSGQEYLQRVRSAVSYNEFTPDVRLVEQMVRLAVDDICPEQKAGLDSLIGAEGNDDE